MISIIISFYERLDHLRCCLDSLRHCSKEFDEVIITDDGSSEATVARLENLIGHYPFSVRHIWQPKNGFRVAAARNNGIRHARGNYLVFLDSDFLVLSDTIRAHLRLAEPGRFVAGHCKYLDEHETKKILQSDISPDFSERLYTHLSEKEIIRQHRRFIKRTVLMKLHLMGPRKQSLGGHLSIHLKDIKSINGYDENYVGWGGEDEDLGIRLIKAGIYGRSAIRYARALHLWHPKEIGEKHWQQGPNIHYFKRKDVPFYCKNGLEKTSFGTFDED